MAKRITNPFGDDSSDEEEYNNPFSKKTPSKAKPGDSIANPFDDDYTAPKSAPNSITKAPAIRRTISNPFEGRYNDINPTKQSSTTSNNPFEDDSGTTSKTTNISVKSTQQKVSTNPFDLDAPTNAGSDDNAFSYSIPKPLVSQRPSVIERDTTELTANKKTNNPFDDDFGQGSNANTTTTTASTPIKQNRWNVTSGSNDANAKSTTNSSTNNEPVTASLTNWFRGSATTTAAAELSESMKQPIMNNTQESSKVSNNRKSFLLTPKRKKAQKTIANKDTSTSSPKRPNSPRRKIKNYIVKCWPYDNYHQEQNDYFTYLSERESQDGPSPTGSSPPASPSRSDKKKKNDSSDGNDTLKPIQSMGTSSENQLFERPQELPSIQEAVQNLSLLDFEKKAEQRAVAIVSTWLYDAGLIDELLANGGNGGTVGSSRYNTDAQTIASVRSSEGVEVGMHGFPLEGVMKIDKEVEKLRANAQRELTLINTRLNDGVAASGSEVKEMVDAVAATRMDLGRLRELVTYISSGYKNDGFGSDDDKNESAKLMISDFPRLKRAINARRNIFRCFRELEFFSQIPLTCDTLREELHSGEWTDHEFITIRNVCMEHVKLEILLVEAEAGMKTWFDDDDGDDESSMPSVRSSNSLRRRWRGKRTTLTSTHYQVVDDFLSQHVKNVWELGDEIRVKILSGIENAFDLAMKNPQEMVALVEAIEVYEHAAEQYKESYGDTDDESTKNHLRFTNMRAAALSQLYTVFELRGLEVFRQIHMQAADLADEKDALNSQFNAVMRAATQLVTEIDLVKNQMAPLFAPHWRVEMLWSACVAHVCSNQIIQQIGGPEGQHLPDLNVTQLLDLVAWVEFFRETIEEAFPSIGKMHSKKTYFDQRPDLIAGNDNEVNMENATDIIAWTNNMLWEVHRLAQDEFLIRTRSQTEELLTKVYTANHETYQTNEMRLVSSLCEDVFSLVGVHLRTIRDRLTKKSEALVMAVCLIFSQLRSKQMKYRDRFLKDLDTCCAAANDFQRMSEQCEDLLQDLVDQSDFSEKSLATLDESCNALVSLFSGDAVYAAQMAHTYIFEPIWEAIADDLFTVKWETELTHNELALKLTRTLVSNHNMCSNNFKRNT